MSRRRNYRFKVGDKVVSITPISNGWAEMPKGTVFTINRRFKGYELVSDPCRECGLKVRITRVSGGDFMRALAND